MTIENKLDDVQIKRIRNDLEVINSFNSTPGQGITRLTFSPEHQRALAYVVQELETLGAHVWYDAAGNLRGRLPGAVADSPAVMAGSHLDTVIHGGGYDGQVGVIAALEVCRVIASKKISHRLPVDLIVFAEEEGSRFDIGLLGSSICTGKLERKALTQIRDKDGVSYRQAMDQAGIEVVETGGDHIRQSEGDA